jgi:hypothetical protein
LTWISRSASVRPVRFPLPFALAAISIPCPALADEGEWVLALEPEVGVFDPSGGGDNELGAGGQATFWIGLSPASWLFASTGAEVSLTEGPEIGEAVVGAVAALDVLRTIPFLEAGGGLSLVRGEVMPLLRLGLGADYLVSPTFSVGAVVRYRPFFGDGDQWLTFHLRIALRGEL